MKEYVRGRYRWECPRCFLQMFEQDGESLGSFDERVYAHKMEHFDSEDFHFIWRKMKSPLMACNYCLYTVPSLGRWKFFTQEDKKYHNHFIKTIDESSEYLKNHFLIHHRDKLFYMWKMPSRFHD